MTKVMQVFMEFTYGFQWVSDAGGKDILIDASDGFR